LRHKKSKAEALLLVAGWRQDLFLIAGAVACPMTRALMASSRDWTACRRLSASRMTRCSAYRRTLLRCHVIAQNGVVFFAIEQFSGIAAGFRLSAPPFQACFLEAEVLFAERESLRHARRSPLDLDPAPRCA
jgi:hypothetical protein